MRERIEPYTALIVQPEVTVVEDREGIQKNLDRVIKMIHFGVGYFWEVPVRLVILPEYFMQGVGTPGKGESKIEDQMKKAVTIPGPEIDQLGAIAKEYGRRGISCNAVVPGYLETEMTDAFSADARKAREHLSPHRRFGQPGEVVEAILFLASCESSYVNGDALYVSGAVQDVPELRT